MRISVAVLFVPILVAADPPTSKEERIQKTRAALRSPKVEVRRQTIGSLVHSDLSESMAADIRAALKDEDWKVRETTGSAIGNLGARAVPAVPEIIKQLEADPVKEARETAARALGRIGKAVKTERRAVGPLRRAAVEDVDAVTQVVALGALAMMEENLPGQIVALRKFLHHDEMLVRMKAAHALGMIGLPAKAAAAEIVEVLKRETDEHRRGYVARALGSVGDSASLPALYEALKKETYEGAKGEMRGAIGRLGGKPPSEK